MFHVRARSLVAIGAITAALMLLINSSAYLYALGALVAVLVPALAVLRVLVLVSSGWSERRSNALGTRILVALWLGATPLLWWLVRALPLHATTGRAQEIESGLLRFVEEQGRCPETLEELTPKYLRRVPRSWTGPLLHSRFRYHGPSDGVASRPHCWVAVDYIAMIWCVRGQDGEGRGRWICDD